MEIHEAVMLYRTVRTDYDDTEGLHLFSVVHCSNVVGRIECRARNRSLGSVGDRHGNRKF